jgi:hypothetical protein
MGEMLTAQRPHSTVHIPYYGNQLAIFSRPPGATTEIVDILRRLPYSARLDVFPEYDMNIRRKWHGSRASHVSVADARLSCTGTKPTQVNLIESL